jgi:hypothetical protein
MKNKLFLVELVVGIMMFGCTTFVAVNTDMNGVEITWNGHRYKRIDEGKTWAEAKVYCEKLGGHLATITSAEEQATVYNLVAKGNKNLYWIGGQYTAGDWAWVTGEQWEYTNWAPEEPNNLGGSESYVQIYRINVAGITNSVGKWNDLANTGDSGDYSLTNSGFICEWENLD